MRKFLLAILLTGYLSNVFAQNQPVPETTKKEKQIDQFVGVQLNPLIRQVLNFNNSTASPIVSGYLLTYNINSRKTGWGLRLGAGVNYNTNWSNDGITETTTDNSHIQARIGIEKAFKLSDKWSAGAGADFLTIMNDNHTTTTVRQFDTVITDTKSKVNSYGGGAMAWLRYNITNRISLGTETSLYYTTGKQDNVTRVTQRQRTPGGGGTQITTTETRAKPTTSNTAVQLPVVFYLIIRI